MSFFLSLMGKIESKVDKVERQYVDKIISMGQWKCKESSTHTSHAVTMYSAAGSDNCKNQPYRDTVYIAVA